MYTVKKDDGKWGVYEIDTKQFVISYKKESDARKTTRSLNLGAGFQGMTPPFMTVSYVDETKRKAVRTERPFT